MIHAFTSDSVITKKKHEKDDIKAERKAKKNFQEPREPKVENYSYYSAWIIESYIVGLKQTVSHISLHFLTPRNFNIHVV